MQLDNDLFSHVCHFDDSAIHNARDFLPSIWSSTRILFHILYQLQYVIVGPQAARYRRLFTDVIRVIGVLFLYGFFKIAATPLLRCKSRPTFSNAARRYFWFWWLILLCPEEIREKCLGF